MQWWAIIKMIAGIIANLPFDADEDQIRSAVVIAVDTVQGDSYITANARIQAGDWDELIELLVPVIQWFLRRFKKPSV